ncbi:MAG: short-chain dehydrogenase [Bradyrhizobium sp.]|nr:short-chain dehydrogenase [Bradyrhizobium sp.]
MKLCNGRVAIVTGAGRGVGREYALLLAAHGAKVLVNDLGAAPDGSGVDQTPAQGVVDEIRALGGEAVANGDDVSSWSGARNMIDAAIGAFGKLDVLVNNAGILRDRMIVNMTEQEWDSVIQVHLKGTFAPTRHAAEYWRGRAKETGAPVNARVINTSSTSGVFGNVGQSNYGAAKAGIAAFSIIAAREFSRIGVTVNTIVPTAQTRLTENLRELNDEERDLRDPKWIAPVVAYLASEESSDITARTIQVGNGVLSVLEGWHRGPQCAPILDPAELAPILRRMAQDARRNSGMKAQDLD